MKPPRYGNWFINWNLLYWKVHSIGYWHCNFVQIYMFNLSMQTSYSHLKDLLNVKVHMYPKTSMHPSHYFCRGSWSSLDLFFSYLIHVHTLCVLLKHNLINSWLLNFQEIHGYHSPLNTSSMNFALVLLNPWKLRTIKIWTHKFKFFPSLVN